MKNSVIVLHTDTDACVSVIRKQSSREKVITVLVGQPAVVGLKYNIVCQAQHMPGQCNTMPDAFSHLQVKKFRVLHPQMDTKLYPFPELPPVLT